MKLNSHVLHPQIKSGHANPESAKLMNHDTSPSGDSSIATGGVSSGTVDKGAATSIMKSGGFFHK